MRWLHAAVTNRRFDLFRSPCEQLARLDANGFAQAREGARATLVIDEIRAILPHDQLEWLARLEQFDGAVLLAQGVEHWPQLTGNGLHAIVGSMSSLHIMCHM